MKLNKDLTRKELNQLRSLYEESFPPEEKKPFSLMLKKQEEGHMELLAIEDNEGEFLGLAIMILHKDIALLDYLSISQQWRGQGIGTEVLGLLQHRYQGKTLLLEIEDPEETADNTPERIRRKTFYLRNGMREMPYKIRLFGVKMLVLTKGRSVPFEQYHKIFETVFPSNVGENITLA